ncbi:chaperone protein DnaJ-like isoform X1 [Salvia hispanica]|uniref:chaperone protein DnaJ-like isoform X1 n=1 Tax=Salvia hispanica TaxID=49212 RepID=UPI002009B99B|nr:chaperone protein DnaJ-like isoform X1 [Salvia hispanica]
MMCEESYDFNHKEEPEDNSHFNFDFCSLVSKPKDYYKILEVDYDASDEAIRSNYIRLALRWHPDKKKSEETATSKFQEISEAYQVLSDPVKRHEYDNMGMLHTLDSNIAFWGMQDYLNRYKGLILTCNGLGMKCSMW